MPASTSSRYSNVVDLKRQLATMRAAKAANVQERSTGIKIEHTTIRTRGWIAWVDKYAMTQRGHLHFLSMVGRQTAVKAIAAALLTHRHNADNIYLEDPRHERVSITKEYNNSKWRNKHIRLSATNYQQIVVSNGAFFKPDDRYTTNHFTLLVPPGASRELLFYQFLDRRLSIPLHPSWASWLWNLHRPKPHANEFDDGIYPMRTLGCQAYLVNVKSNFDIEKAITDAILYHELETVTTITEERS